MSSGLYQIRDKDLDTTLDLTKLRPYGDTMNDGKVQTSFTLPVKDDDKGAAAAVMLAQKMGLADPNVALRQKLDEMDKRFAVAKPGAQVAESTGPADENTPLI